MSLEGFRLFCDDFVEKGLVSVQRPRRTSSSSEIVATWHFLIAAASRMVSGTRHFRFFYFGPTMLVMSLKSGG